MVLHRISSTWIWFLEREQNTVKPQGALGSQSKKKYAIWDLAAWRPATHSRLCESIKRAKFKWIKLSSVQNNTRISQSNLSEHCVSTGVIMHKFTS